MTLTLLLVVGSGVGGSGTTGSLTPHARAGGSPPPLLLASSQQTVMAVTPPPHQTQATLLSLGSLLALQSLHFRYQRGYSVQHGWLCLGWASGALRCTQHWRRSGGRYISLNPSWVPSEGSSEGSAAASVVSVASVVSSTSPAPAHLSQWASTGRASYPEPRGTFQGYTWGWCTSGAAMLAHDNLRGLGNAAEWARNAAARGMRVSSSPVAGATAVFQPGVQGAGGGGHVSHVAAVYGNGWFLSEDVNFWWNGGGFGRISFRYAHAGPGVSFIL